MDLEERSKNLGRLWWITDAPLFVDEVLVRRIHDAVIWPEFEEEYVEKTKFSKVTRSLEGAAKAEGEGEFKLPELIEWLSPKLIAKSALEGSVARMSEDESKSVVKGNPVVSSERKLNDLAVEYLSEFPERLLFVDVPGGQFSNFQGEVTREQLDKLLDSPPRPVVFVNILPGAPLFPTVAEMEAGEFRPIFPALDRIFLARENPTPRYDDRDKGKRSAYWAAVSKNFGSRVAMQELEKACGRGRIGWIDFRILFDNEGSTGHLHVVPAGKAHAGIFGYNFVHRGHKYGCRVVATLKSGTDMNVLAIYER